jgi:hypothetical protein
VVSDVIVDVRDDEVLVVVSDSHHPFLGARRFVIEDDGDDTHQIPPFEFLVFELSEEISRCLPDDLTPTRIAVFLGEFVEAVQKRIRHRDADDGHMLNQRHRDVKDCV